MKKLLAPVLAFLAGIVVTALVGWLMAPGMMVKETASPNSVEVTVEKMVAKAESMGWKVSGVTKLDENIVKAGGPETRPVRLVNLCEPNHAGKILADDTAMVVATFMPCTISVYQKSDGKAYIGTMNSGLMGKMFGGVVAEVMGGPVSADQAEFVKAAIAQ